MDRQGKTIYQTARYTTTLSGETVAGILHRSLDSIRDYESGRTIPPDDVVNDMAELYNAPWLALLHLKSNNLVGQEHLPGIQLGMLSASVLDFRVEMRHALSILDVLDEIGRDNTVSDHELDDWAKCKQEISELIAAGYKILFSPVNTKMPPMIGG